EELRAELGESFTAVPADAADPTVAGYAGAKATIRWLTSYAAAESDRGGLGIRFVSVLPQLTPATAPGAAYVDAYAAREGMDTAAFLARSGPAVTPSTSAGRSSISPAPATAKTPTCSPPQAFAPCLGPPPHRGPHNRSNGQPVTACVGGDHGELGAGRGLAT